MQTWPEELHALGIHDLQRLATIIGNEIGARHKDVSLSPEKKGPHMDHEVIVRDNVGKSALLKMKEMKRVMIIISYLISCSTNKN